MRKTLLFIMVALFLNAACADPIPPRLMRNIRGYQVMKVGLKKGALRLTTTHGTVGFDIYEKVIGKGVCSVLSANPKKGWEKARIDRVEVLNKDEQQGYLFVDARESCLELERIDENARKTWLSEKTGRCAGGICDDPRDAKSEKDKK